MTQVPNAFPREILTQLYEVAVQRALQRHNTAAYLPKPPKGRTIVIGSGKAFRSNRALCHP
jgi:glycerate 2-kinase